jgi:thioredoxin reductase (NADPH)
MASHYDMIIIWSGPAWHTAAIYAGRANLHPVMFEWFLAWGIAAGGQLTTTTEVENFPGFPDGIDGVELMDRMRQQSLNSGTTIITETIQSVDLDRSAHEGLIQVTSQTGLFYLSKTLVLATGATAKKLDVPGVDHYRNKGISWCAVCDGALPMFRNKHLVVVGGGDVAMEEANHLSKFASEVTVVIRSDKLRASQAMVTRVQSNPKIHFLYRTQVLEVIGDGAVIQWLRLINSQTQQVTTLQCGGLFFAIGHTPNTAFLNNQVACDEHGYIITTPWSTQTSVEGVYACGDVQDKKFRQAITSAGTGCMAALEAEHRLQNH